MCRIIFSFNIAQQSFPIQLLPINPLNNCLYIMLLFRLNTLFFLSSSIVSMAPIQNLATGLLRCLWCCQAGFIAKRRRGRKLVLFSFSLIFYIVKFYSKFLRKYIRIGIQIIQFRSRFIVPT